MKSASEYGTYIRNLFINLASEGLLRRQVLPLNISIQPDNRRGKLFTRDPGFLYHDDAVLRVEEIFAIDSEGEVHREQYAYHYERPGGYYFRFEREHHAGDLIYKPEYHLHVLWWLPHFPSALLTLEETLDFIRVNFYSPHRQRLVGYSLTAEI